MCTVPHRVQSFVTSLLPARSEAAGTPSQARDPGDGQSGAEGSVAPLQEAIETALGAAAAVTTSPSAAAGDTPLNSNHNALLPYVELPFGRYYIVTSVALLLQHIESLLAFGAVPCQLQFDMGARVGELLRVYNARSQQLVLGAGAMASAGLKSITARHMAVCSQGLLLLEALMPYLRHRVLVGVAPASVGQLSSVLDSAAEVRVRCTCKIRACCQNCKHQLPAIVSDRLQWRSDNVWIANVIGFRKHGEYATCGCRQLCCTGSRCTASSCTSCASASPKPSNLSTPSPPAGPPTRRTRAPKPPSLTGCRRQRLQTALQTLGRQRRSERKALRRFWSN